MRIQELSQRLKRIESKRDTGAIKVELSDGVVEIKHSQITAFGANALFLPHSEERSIVLNSVSHTEDQGRMFELLQMVLTNESVLPTGDSN